MKKRTRSERKDSIMVFESHVQSDAIGNNSKRNNPFFNNVSGLFVGLSRKGLLSDCNSIRSPTSSLDIRTFLNLDNKSSRPVPKKWDSTKVGLSIIDSLDDDSNEIGKFFRLSESRKIVFGPKMRIKLPNFESHASSFETPKSEIFPRGQIKFPLHNGIFEIGETALVPEPFGKSQPVSLDSCPSSSIQSSIADHTSILNSGNFSLENLTTQTGSPPIDKTNLSHSKLNSTLLSVFSGLGSIESLSASEIELSEDYTCVICRGPNPKTTHIFGDSILECHSSSLSNFDKNEKKEIELPRAATNSASLYRPDDFLSFCYSCNKKLDGKDIFIYRGEKSFCSLTCRSQEILIDDATEDSIDVVSENTGQSQSHEKLFESGVFRESPLN